MRYLSISLHSTHLCQLPVRFDRQFIQTQNSPKRMAFSFISKYIHVKSKLAKLSTSLTSFLPLFRQIPPERYSSRCLQPHLHLEYHLTSTLLSDWLETQPLQLHFLWLLQPTSKRNIEKIYYYFMKSLERIEYNNR